ncbi:MAG: hypothetical protein EP329_06755 [Deltaproteobacteria bacterium]|nr:MAG: hypothetical protein EP329_06755 [Deltaproteobacteria bacterium]
MSRLLPLAVAALGLSFAACDIGGDAYLLSESEGVAVVRAALEARGYHPDDTTHGVSDVVVCPADGACDAPLSYVLDGWDGAAGVGFEYVSEDDPDFAAHPELTSGHVSETRDAVAALGDATAAAVAPAHVLVFRPWAHETRYLAEEQLRSHVDAELDALGL